MLDRKEGAGLCASSLPTPPSAHWPARHAENQASMLHRWQHALAEGAMPHPIQPSCPHLRGVAVVKLDHLGQVVNAPRLARACGRKGGGGHEAR